MEEVNDDWDGVDLALLVGANDTVNRRAEGGGGGGAKAALSIRRIREIGAGAPRRGGW